ncbi:putative rxt2-like protein [Eutypa lata UCREL1]|uniref:Putative rxt2-like protein n=1 Tax=Eutypa lata (strain UCR-EL1) TaxID=1287681 RepID=M7T4V8_EUTLA|nr:putative rxt2-like protein [Eutypa lata UCREL1]
MTSHLQHVRYSETIVAMKKARKRKAYESDSDSEVQTRDDEGYEFESDDDNEEQIQKALKASAEFNPYANVRLQNILSPLIAVTDLPSHPTLSRPYTTKTLVELAEQGRNVMQKENKALWKIKHLQTRLMGDHTWIPCEMMLGPNDLDLYRDDYLERMHQDKGSTRSDASVLALENPQGEGSTNGKVATNGDVTTNGAKDPVAEAGADISMVDAEPFEGDNDIDAESKPEANKGESSEVSRLKKLKTYDGSYNSTCKSRKKADRLRKTVLQWSKYEAHVGPNRDMSDGEDWYDKEEWGLEEDLKKGQDEEEEDTTQPAKKTRTRR